MALVLTVNYTFCADWRAVTCKAKVTHVLLRMFSTRSLYYVGLWLGTILRHVSSVVSRTRMERRCPSVISTGVRHLALEIEVILALTRSRPLNVEPMALCIGPLVEVKLLWWRLHLVCRLCGLNLIVKVLFRGVLELLLIHGVCVVIHGEQLGCWCRIKDSSNAANLAYHSLERVLVLTLRLVSLLIFSL